MAFTDLYSSHCKKNIVLLSVTAIGEMVFNGTVLVLLCSISCLFI